jgi:collagenase-like PrtC family protease
MLGLIDKVLSLFDNRKLACEVGYQMDNPELMPALRQYAGQVTDVYFTLPGDPTYYGAWGIKGGMEWKALYANFLRDLDEIRNMGISAIVCVDASCYGANFASEELMKHIAEMLRSISEHIRIRAVTVSTFPVAECLRHMNSSLKIRASEGMHLMSVRQLVFTRELFNGYYIGYESVRDLDEIERMRKWCDDNGKSLHIVPNNACIYRCPYYIYHGNVQSHMQDFMLEEDESETPFGKPAPCERLLAKPENKAKLLQGMWIRPEDMRHVSYYFDSMRLATRTSKNLKNIVSAYCEGRWDGNLCDILESMHDHSAAFPVIHNNRFPKDWFKKTSTCGHRCESCHYCEKVLKNLGD